MLSKISFFNPGIFKKNITLYWPIWGLYAFICIISLPLRLFLDFNNLRYMDLYTPAELLKERTEALENLIVTCLNPSLIWVFALAIVMAVFFYTYQTRSCYAIHALPVCRRSLFLTNVSSALCFMIIPQFISYLATLFLCLGYGVTDVTYLLHGFLLTFFAIILFLSLAVFSVMVTGHILATPIFYVAFQYIYIVLEFVLEECIIKHLVYGIESVNFTGFDFLSPHYYLLQIIPHNGLFSYFYGSVSDLNLNTIYTALGLYALVGLGLFFLAYLVYRRKQLETTGDMITLPVFIPIIRWIVTFIGASCVSLIWRELFFYNGAAKSALRELLPSFLISAVIIFFLSDMILQKRFRVFQKKRLGECGAFLIASTLLLIVMKFNGFGIETRIPNLNQIEQITLSGEYAILVDKEDYETILNLHKDTIQNKETYENYIRMHHRNDLTGVNFDIQYTLKNGKVMVRSYYIPYIEGGNPQENATYHTYVGLLEKPAYIIDYHFTSTPEDLQFVSGAVYYTIGENYTSEAFEIQDCNTIAAALIKDIEAGNYDLSYYYGAENKEFLDPSIHGIEISMEFSVPKGSYVMTHGSVIHVTNEFEYFFCHVQLNGDCIYTLEALENLEFPSKEHK